MRRGNLKSLSRFRRGFKIFIFFTYVPILRVVYLPGLPGPKNKKGQIWPKAILEKPNPQKLKKGKLLIKFWLNSQNNF